MKINDSESINIVSVSNKDESQVEAHAEFLFIYEVQKLFNNGTSITLSADSNSSKKNRIMESSISFGSKFATVCIETLIEDDKFLQVLHTPSIDYVLQDESSDFTLPKHGLLWLQLAFYEAHRLLSNNIRKTADYKFYNKRKDCYEYLAVYAYNTALFNAELQKHADENEALFNELRSQFDGK